VRADYQAPPDAPNLADSPVRRLVGRPLTGSSSRRGDDEPAPDSLRELVFLDRVNEIAPADQLPGAARLPRLFDEDYGILALLDRAGLAPRVLIGRACLPGRGATAVSSRLTKLYRHGLIAQHTIGLRQHARSDGKPPLLYSITRRGLEVAQQREPAPAISPRREWRPIEQSRAARLPHDLHALGWAIALHRTVGALATDNWRTPRYATGRYPVPQTGHGHKRHPLTAAELDVPEGHAYLDLPPFREVKPDLSLELRLPSLHLTFDLLLELDLTARPSYNHDKLRAYDAFLTGWAPAHPRYRALATRPVTIFAFRDHHGALACAQDADRLLTGRIGRMGTPAHQWAYTGRRHLFFAAEPDIYPVSLRAFALPPLPPNARRNPRGANQLEIHTVELLPPTVIRSSPPTG